MHKIVMKNLRRVQTISDVLQMERQRILSELIKTNLHIQDKLTILKKFFLCLVNFNNQWVVKYRQLSHRDCNPQVFNRKLAQLIILEEIEIAKLLVINRALSERVLNIDRKIQLMTMFQTRPRAKVSS